MCTSVLTRSLLRRYNVCRRGHSHAFHVSVKSMVVKPFLLADIGEGIRECEVIQWFVQPEARVEEFDKICEVQSDKASVDIPSRFSGVIKKLYYEAGDMAQVGKPLIDIDVQEDMHGEPQLSAQAADFNSYSNTPAGYMAQPEGNSPRVIQQPTLPMKEKIEALATPAVRHLIKELDVDIREVAGTGKDGRVTKDDIHKYASSRAAQSVSSSPEVSSLSKPTSPAVNNGSQKETILPLKSVQAQMFKTMTRSLSIPHFLYADEINFTNLSNLRQRLNKVRTKADQPTLSLLPFIIKAMSLSLNQHPILNARVDLSNPKPALIMRSQHNIGIAMDTPSGLLVPVIQNVGARSITSIALELSRLKMLASSNKLTSSDLSGGTITLSNIGSIGGTYVAPILVDNEVAILGVGKVRMVPAFDEVGTVVARRVCCFSWSADHRVIDGATMARAAESVRGFVEEPDSMLVGLK